MILQKAKKGFRAQAPLYRSIADFVNLVSNHPELSRDANFPSDENDVDFIPFDKVDEIEHISDVFLEKEAVRRRRRPPAQKDKPSEEKERGGAERSEATTSDADE